MHLYLSHPLKSDRCFLPDTRTFLIFFIVVFFIIQISFQYPSSLGTFSKLITTSSAAQLVQSSQLNLRLSHMFAPFEPKYYSTRIMNEFYDGRLEIVEGINYRASFKWSTTNFLEMMVTKRIHPGKPLDSFTKRFIQARCRLRTGLNSLSFETAHYSIEQIIGTYGNLNLKYVNLATYHCSNIDY